MLELEEQAGDMSRQTPERCRTGDAAQVPVKICGQEVRKPDASSPHHVPR